MVVKLLIRLRAYFNPRSREGSDEKILGRRFRYDISIHAPAKGATVRRRLERWGLVYFNPRSREGSDRHLDTVGIHWIRFQSTLPRRERRQRCYSDNGSNHFNPRSREGSDTPSRKDYYIRCISIHAPAKGATSTARNEVGRKKFQSTLPRRERRASGSGRRTAGNISIHAPAKGATRLPHRSLYRLLHFNPRSREGSDIKHGALFWRKIISIHAPAKGATILSHAAGYQRSEFQSTLPRRERRATPVAACLQAPAISIHAPAKGATT